MSINNNAIMGRGDYNKDNLGVGILSEFGEIFAENEFLVDGLDVGGTA